MGKFGGKKRLIRNAATCMATLAWFSATCGFASAEDAALRELQDRAVILARNGEYDEALRIFEENLGVGKIGGGSDSVVYDYMSVLQWQGNDTAVTAIYETRYASNPVVLPAYLLRTVGDAYYRLSRYGDAEKLYLAARAAGDEMSAEGLEKTALLLGKLNPESPQVSAVPLNEYAVILARRNDFTTALAILERLIERDDASAKCQADYIVVLAWADKQQEALEFYETHFTDAPEQLTPYAQKTVGELLMAEGRYGEAQELYERLAAQGGDALYLAQFRARVGNFAEAMDYYDQAVAAAPHDFSVYLERARAWLSGGAYASADRDFRKARSLLLPNEAERRRDIDAERATLFIRAGEFAEGRDVLAPYVEAGTATLLMQCDYIVALQGTVNYDRAIAEGERLWPDKTTVPAYGLQSLADCYLRKRDYATAVRYHTIVLAQNVPQRRNSLLSRAYAHVRLGELAAAKKDYEAAAREFSLSSELVAGDAKGLFELQNFHSAKEIFRTLAALDQVNDLTYRQHYAFDLLINEMPREAYAEYRRLVKETDAKEQGYAGMAQAALLYGNYSSARAAIEKLALYDSGSKEAAEARKAWDNRWRGSFSIGGRFFKNYQTKSYLYNDMELETDLGNSWRLLIEGQYNTFREDLYNDILDRVERPQADVPAFGAGLRYMGHNFDIAAVGLQLRSSDASHGYRWGGNYYFNDFTWLSYAQRRTMTESTGGVRGGVMTTERDLTVNRRVGSKDLYTLGYVWNTYSDGNRNRGLYWRFGHMAVRNAQKEIEWYVQENYSNWQFESPLYDSPDRRSGYGPGLRMRWMRPRIDYWELTAELSFGYDAPDNTDFTPFVRLEKGWELGPDQSLSIGGEYGWRSDRTNDVKTLRQGYRQFDIRYNLSW